MKLAALCYLYNSLKYVNLDSLTMKPIDISVEDFKEKSGECVVQSSITSLEICRIVHKGIYQQL